MTYKKTLPEKLCLIPYMGLNIHPTGTWQLCSSSRKQYPINFEQDFSNIWKGETLQSVRQKMLSNQEVLPNCSGCYKLEKKGVESKRTRYNKKRLNFYGEQFCYDSVYNEKKSIIDLDISFSNLCNLDCVTCNNEYSSSWIKKDQQALKQGLSFRKIKKDRLWKMPKSFIDSLVENSIENIKLIFIKGGEPLIEPNCLYFLEKISNSKKKRNDLIIYIQTNGTNMNPRVISSIKKLNIEISFSVDGLGAYYNWIRGFDFDEMIKNFYKLSKITDVKSSYFNYTISAFNFHRVPDFLDFFIKEKRKNSKLRRLSFSIAHADYINFRVFDKKYSRKSKK